MQEGIASWLSAESDLSKLEIKKVTGEIGNYRREKSLVDS